MSGTSPFSRRTALALVGFGTLVFVLVLALMAGDTGSGATNDGGGHAGGHGLNGFAAFADLVERRGYPVRKARNEAVFEQEGLLVLTPPAVADAEKIARAVTRHRTLGPTLIVLPKWIAFDVSNIPGMTDAKEGWVILSGGVNPQWANGLYRLDSRVDALEPGKAGWRGFGRAGPLPDPRAVQTISSGRLVTIVGDLRGQTLAGFLDDGSAPPDLEVAAGREPEARGEESMEYPVVIVAEPDLLDNWGMADEARAMAALSLLRAITGGEMMPVNFDLTFNGLGRSANLVTLAFTPPFLAATLCLLLAALVIGWRAFVRFGPPLEGERAIAYGKRALVANSAGLLLRARRFHLLGPPYVERVRERLTSALALPRGLDPEAAEAAIDRAAASRGAGEHAFSEAVRRFLAAREPHALVRGALALHSLERTLIR